MPDLSYPNDVLQPVYNTANEIWQGVGSLEATWQQVVQPQARPPIHVNLRRHTVRLPSECLCDVIPFEIIKIKAQDEHMVVPWKTHSNFSITPGQTQLLPIALLSLAQSMLKGQIPRSVKLARPKDGSINVNRSAPGMERVANAHHGIRPGDSFRPFTGQVPGVYYCPQYGRRLRHVLWEPMRFHVNSSICFGLLNCMDHLSTGIESLSCLKSSPRVGCIYVLSFIVAQFVGAIHVGDLR